MRKKATPKPTPSYVTAEVTGVLAVRDDATKAMIPTGGTVQLDPARPTVARLVARGAVKLIEPEGKTDE